MGLVYTIVAALCLWIVCWALKVKAIDAFLIASVIMITAVGIKMLAVHAPGNRRR
jgi:hypothetical protein